MIQNLITTVANEYAEDEPLDAAIRRLLFEYKAARDIPDSEPLKQFLMKDYSRDSEWLSQSLTQLKAVELEQLNYFILVSPLMKQHLKKLNQAKVRARQPQ